MDEGADFGTDSVQVHSYLLLLTVYNFRNFGERGYATKLKKCWKKQVRQRTAKKAKTMRSVSWKETLV